MVFVDNDAGTSSLSLRLHRYRRWIASDDGAAWAFGCALVIAIGVLYVVGRTQWFIRDDWNFIIGRNVVHRANGTEYWLFSAQDGHLLTIPILIYRAIQLTFGLGSYWPYLLTCMIPHVGAVLLLRRLSRRAGVSAWTTTLVCAMLLVFGAGWENIVFGIQLTYNISLVCFLAHLCLTDHDGPVDRRDILGVGVGLVGVLSSGFAPFFIAGIAIFLVMRNRWRAAAVAAAPLAVVYGWWWIKWGTDTNHALNPGSKDYIPAFAVRALVEAFNGLTSISSLAGIAIVATVAVVLWRGDAARQALLVALSATVVLMLAGIGSQRIGNGLETAGAPRYTYMAAMLLAPAFALAIDQLRRLSPAALAAGWAVLVTSLVINAASLYANGTFWSLRAACERHAFELLAGSPKTATHDQNLVPITFEPDVALRDLPQLVREHAITPRVPTTPADLAEVDQALAATPGICVPVIPKTAPD